MLRVSAHDGALLSRLQLGTLNVRTLAGRMGAVLTLASHVGLDVLLMQETRVPDLTWVAGRHFAARRRWIPGGMLSMGQFASQNGQLGQFASRTGCCRMVEGWDFAFTVLMLGPFSC